MSTERSIAPIRCSSCQTALGFSYQTIDPSVELLCNKCLYDYWELCELIGVPDMYKFPPKEGDPDPAIIALRRDTFRDNCKVIRLAKRQYEDAKAVVLEFEL